MSKKNKNISIALLGNPNAGKSTLFNSLTGLNQKTGNYPGVTVDKSIGSYNYNQQKYEVTDLPGTYSLFPKSIDEEVACKALLNKTYDVFDAVVIVVDACNLKRHLLLATQVIDLKKRCVLVLNMIDEADKNNIVIYQQELEKLLDVPVVAVNSRTKKGFNFLKVAIEKARVSDAVFYDLATVHKNFPEFISYENLIQSQFESSVESKTTSITNKIKQFEINDNVSRFSKLSYIVSKCLKQPDQLLKSTTQKLDAVFTHKVYGFLFFFLVLFVV